MSTSWGDLTGVLAEIKSLAPIPWSIVGCAAALIHPETDNVYGIAHTVTALAVHTALTGLTERGCPASAVLITSPTYYGVCSDVAAIAQVWLTRQL